MSVDPQNVGQRCRLHGEDLVRETSDGVSRGRSALGEAVVDLFLLLEVQPEDRVQRV